MAGTSVSTSANSTLPPAILSRSGEFGDLPYRAADPKLCSSSVKNMNKNRYTDILAPDETRVQIDGVLPYINANYIDLCNTKKMIACQGPTCETSIDFWNMIYYKKIRCILMVTALVEGSVQKCHKYWPEDGEKSIKFGSLTVTSTEDSRYDHTTVSKINISGPEGDHSLYHIYHYSWLDNKGTNADIVLFLLKLVWSFSSDVFVCHCSAGAGRTGVVAACLRSILSEEHPIDAIKFIRSQRHGLVQNIQQYRLTKKLVDLLIDNPLSIA